MFDQRNVPSVDSEHLSSYGETSIKTLPEHLGVQKSAETIQGELKVTEPMVCNDDRMGNFPTIYG